MSCYTSLTSDLRLGPLRKYLIDNEFDKKYKISYGIADWKNAEKSKLNMLFAQLMPLLLFVNQTQPANYIFLETHPWRVANLMMICFK